MVRVKGMAEYGGSLQSGGEGETGHVVINSPTEILFSCTRAIRPPGIVMRRLIIMPKGIDEPVIYKLSEPLTLLRQKAGRVLI